MAQKQKSLFSFFPQRGQKRVDDDHPNEESETRATQSESSTESEAVGLFVTVFNSMDDTCFLPARTKGWGRGVYEVTYSLPFTFASLPIFIRLCWGADDLIPV